MFTLINTTTRNAFYTITRRGTTVIVRWGRMGTRGQEKRFNFSTVASAMVFLEEKMEDKLVNRNYRMVHA